MRKIPWVTIVVSAVLGLVAGLFAHDYRTGILLGTDDQHTSYLHKFSANGKYLACLAEKKNNNNDPTRQLKRFDLTTVQPAGEMTYTPQFSPQTDWCCGDDGGLLAVSRYEQFTKDSQGKESVSYHYSFIRRELAGTEEKEIRHWTMTDSEMIPPHHQFAFSRDGAILAHGIHDKGKVTIESIDTKTGDVLKTQHIDNAFFLMSLKELPRRNGFIIFSHPPGNERPGHDSTKMSLLVLDGQSLEIKARYEYGYRNFENWHVTGDGLHLNSGSEKTNTTVLIDLTTGSLVGLPSSTAKAMARLGSGNESRYYQLWSAEFGQSLLIIDTNEKSGGVTKTRSAYHLLDWTANTCRPIEVANSEDVLVFPRSWLPASQSIVLNQYTHHPPNPLLGLYHQMQRMLKWGNPPANYHELAVLDLNTNKKYSWIPFNDSWSWVQAIPKPDGTKILIALADQANGMRLELWDNPALPTLLPRGTYTGVAMMLFSFLLLRLYSTWRHRRLHKNIIPSPATSSQTPSPGSATA